MAQPGYSAYYPQSTYAPMPHSQEVYDTRVHSALHQQPPYAHSPPQQQSHIYSQSSPPIQRPRSSVNNVSYPAAQSLGSQYGPRTHTRPSSTNPYPSPASPPNNATSRRPLPSPRGLPPTPINVQTPSPQQVPHVSMHQPSYPSPIAQPDISNRIPSGQCLPNVSSATQKTSTGSSTPRPLPLPRSAGTFDLVSAQSPPKRALPLPVPTSSTLATNPEPTPAPGQKFVPLWKRALPQPGGSAIVRNAQSQMERRSTVSGGARPLPSPSSTNNVVTVQRDSPTRTSTLSPHLQQSLPLSESAPQSPQPSPRAPTSASTPPGSRFSARERSRTLPLPMAPPNYPPPAQPGSPSGSTGQSILETPISSDDEELTNALLERHPLPHLPSPQFGIRDLPSRNASGPRVQRELPSPNPPSSPIPSGQQTETSLSLHKAAASIRSTPTPPTFRPTHGHSHSLSMSRPMPQLPAQQPPRPQSQQPVNGGWPAALPPLPRAPMSPSPNGTPPQAQTRALPNTPSRPATTGALPISSPFPRSSPRKVNLDLSLDDAPPPSLRRSPAPSPLSLQSSNQSRSPVYFDTPLPQSPQQGLRSPTDGQLQRTPSDAGSVFSLSNFPTPPAHVTVPPSPLSPHKNTFSTQVDGTPPSTKQQTPPSPKKPWQSSISSSPTRQQFQSPPSPTKPWKSMITSQPSQPPPSPTKPWQSTISSPRRQQQAFKPPPSPPKQTSSHFSAAHSHFQPPTSTPSQSSQGTPRTPKISFPVSSDCDSDEYDGIGPAINISSPDNSSRRGPPSLPQISFGGDDSGDDNELPSINIGGVDDGPSIPQIALPGAPTSASPRKNKPQTRKIQETLSNPRLEAAKRSGLVCGGCGGAIIGRIVSAMDMRWHPGCFRCCVCDELLENLSSYAHDGRPYCHLDYHEHFAPRCYTCETAIVDERFITLDDPELGKRTYHEQHFFCAECGDPFLPPSAPGAPSRTFAGDGAFTASAEEDVGFTVYKGHPYCEACHVRLRMPKCKKCKRSIRDGMQAVEALGGKWCWECFTCASCDKPFENPAFFQRDGKPFCEPCFSIMIKNEI